MPVEKSSGHFSHVLFALALESSEALAELVHKQIREAWGITDTPNLSKRDMFTAKYHGCRYNFGYPVSPRHRVRPVLLRLG